MNDRIDTILFKEDFNNMNYIGIVGFQFNKYNKINNEIEKKLVFNNNNYATYLFEKYCGLIWYESIIGKFGFQMYRNKKCIDQFYISSIDEIDMLLSKKYNLKRR